MPRVLNQSKGSIVAEQVQVADTIWSRFWGLMGRRSLPQGPGLFLKPTSSIHTTFMRFPIDVVFLDREGRVVKVVPELKPFRVTASLMSAHSALELPAGAAAQAHVEPGDRLVMVDA